jgi:hypothetical protein
LQVGRILEINGVEVVAWGEDAAREVLVIGAR